MNIQVEERLSDSPFVERVWRGQTREAGEFTSIAISNWSLIVWQENSETNVAIRGPETVATLAPVPEDSPSFGVIFKLGTVMQNLAIHQIVNSQLELPQASNQSFWLNNASWELPTYENIDVFVNRLIRNDILAYDSTIQDIFYGTHGDFSVRTAQRRFLKATGISQNAFYQIERARQTAVLLKNGVSTLDAMIQAGYYDQPHLTRSLKRYIGLTPTQIIDNAKPLSFLYKTSFL